ncbi:DNA-binding protein [Aeromonas veronii]
MKRAEQWSRFDAVDCLATEADMVAYLQAALEDGDTALLTAAFDDVERARAKLRDDGKPSYTLEELLAQCGPNAISRGEMALGSRLEITRNKRTYASTHNYCRPHWLCAIHWL